MKSIQKILEGVEKGCFFDSHYVSASLIKDYSEDYHALENNIDSDNNLTLRTHQQIGHKIAKFEGKLVERQPAQSFSMNVNDKGSSCALWKRV